MRARFLFILIAFWSSTSFSGEIERLGSMDPMKDKKAFLKQAVKAFKESKKLSTSAGGSPEYLEFLESQRRDQIEEANVCVDCPNLLLLTEQVNKILQEQKKTLDEGTPASVFNEIDSLDGLFYFVKSASDESDSLGANNNCEKREYGFQGLYPKNQNLNLDEHIMLFTEEVDLKKISQLHFTNGGEVKTYYLRGEKPHQDVIVKVVVKNRHDPAEITYYRHKTIVLRKKIQESHDKAVKHSLKASQENALKSEGTKEKVDKLTLDYGFEKDDDSFIPKKVTLLGVQGITHFESATLRAGTEISSDKIGAEVELSSIDKKDYLKLEVKDDAKLKLNGRTDFDSFAISSQVQSRDGKNSGAIQLRNEKNEELLDLSLSERGDARLGVPLQFNVYDTGLLVDGKVVVGQDGHYGGTWVISDRHDKTRYLDVGMRARKDGAGVSMGHSRKLSKDSKLSIKLTHDEFGNQKATGGWIQYSLDF